MRSTVVSVGLALLVALTMGSSVIASSAASLSELSAAETGTYVMFQEGDSGLRLTDDGRITLERENRNIGLNSEARFTFGDPSDPVDRHAFAVHANSSTRDELLVQYVDGSGRAVDHVQLRFYSSTGAEVGRIDFDDKETTLKLDSTSTTFYVVMTIDTTGISPGHELPGRLTFIV